MPTNGPSFLVHQGSDAQDFIPDFLARVATTHGNWRVGSSVFLPRYVPTTGRQIAQRLEAVSSYAIADPETHRLEDPFPERGRGRDHYAYLQESDPSANRSRFVRNVVDAQSGTGLAILVSPWLTHGTDAVGRHLRGTLRFATETLDNYAAPGTQVVIGVAATEAVLGDGGARDDLLDELVELPQAPIYFRMRVTPSESYTQYANDVVLRGLWEFVSALTRNGRPVLLPQSGLCGWLMMGAGAVAFGSGTSGSLQRFALATPGFGRQPLEWFFLPQLLGFVLRDEAAAISQVPGYQDCSCPYCPDIDLDTGPLDRRFAAGHYLWWCAYLANQANDLTQIQQQVQAAQGFWADVQQASLILDRRSEPRHLGAWSQVMGL